MNNCTDPDPNPIYGVLFLPGFLLGFVTASLILVMVPELYRKLQFLKCCGSSQKSILHKEERCSDSMEVTRSNDYSEIDEKETFDSPEQMAANRTSSNKETRQRYEQCSVGKQTHKYSDLDDKTSGKNTDKKTTNHSYEPFAPGNLTKKQDTIENHDYFILEPGSDKRLPVKQLECKTETLERDPGHVYFILEPGTNRVKPVSQYFADNEARNSNYQETGHTYFVLEPMTETNESETLAYAVNDVATNPSYFILEKTERYA